MENIGKRRRIALVLAGGCGGRMHMETPKQFLLLHGIPVIAHTLRAFEHHPEIDIIAVVCLSGWEEYVERVKRDFHITKLQYIFPGGINSHISIGNGIKGLSHYCIGEDIVLVHEAVRPLLSARIISDNIRICELHGNAITAIRDNEAVMYTEDGTSSYRCFPREQMYKAQTPHTFVLKDLEIAYQEAEHESICAQSLYTLMAELKHFPLYIAEGDRRNIKLTHPEDIRIAEALLSTEMM